MEDAKMKDVNADKLNDFLLVLVKHKAGESKPRPATISAAVEKTSGVVCFHLMDRVADALKRLVAEVS
jgi:hypothetical protein